MYTQTDIRIARRLRARGRNYGAGDIAARRVRMVKERPQANLMRPLAADCLNGAASSLQLMTRQRRVEAARALRLAFATDTVLR